MNIIDHGEFDHLTPPIQPSDVDQAIARHIRCALSLDEQLGAPATLQQQLVRNGLSAHSDPFEWLHA